MTELTEKQFKTRWADIKKQISERPLLAYRVNIPLDKWDAYMHSVPPKDEINRIYFAVQDDRKVKTARIKNELSKIVGYREAKEFSKRCGVSDSSIRDIIEGKKDMAGYDLINKLEIFLNAIISEFELSIENPLTPKDYARDFLGKIATDLNHSSDRLKQYCFKLTEMARKGETERNYTGAKASPTESLDYIITGLNGLKTEIDTFWDIYIEKKN